MFKVHGHSMNDLCARQQLSSPTASHTWIWLQGATEFLSVMGTIFHCWDWAPTGTLGRWEEYNVCVGRFVGELRLFCDCFTRRTAGDTRCDWLNINRRFERLCTMWIIFQKGNAYFCKLQHNSIKSGLNNICFFCGFPTDTQRHGTWVCQAGDRCGLQALRWGFGVFQWARSGSSH